MAKKLNLTRIRKDLKYQNPQKLYMYIKKYIFGV